jgi:hypothetical protein
MTGINEGQVRIFVKNNSEIPLYFDNVTASVVYKRTTTPLFKEVNKLYLSLKSKYDEEIASLSNRF